MPTSNDSSGVENASVKESMTTSERIVARDYDNLSSTEKGIIFEKIEILLAELHLLRKKVEYLGIGIAAINWLEDWNPFPFKGLPANEVVEKKRNIELYARGFLSEFNSENGTNFNVTNVGWIPNDPTPDSASIYMFLNPPAKHKHGGGQGTVTPQSPPQPPPPPY